MGALARTLLGRAAQLRKRQDRHFQLFGDALQAPRDVTDFLGAVFETPVAGDELEVVHDQEVQALFRFEPPRLGAELHDAQGGGVLDIERRLGEAAERASDARPVLRMVEETAAEAMAVDARLRAKHADNQRFLAHFEREHADGFSEPGRRVGGDVEGQSGFPERGARCHHNQFTWLKARS